MNLQNKKTVKFWIGVTLGVLLLITGVTFITKHLGNSEEVEMLKIMLIHLDSSFPNIPDQISLPKKLAKKYTLFVTSSPARSFYYKKCTGELVYVEAKQKRRNSVALDSLILELKHANIASVYRIFHTIYIDGKYQIYNILDLQKEENIYDDKPTKNEFCWSFIEYIGRPISFEIVKGDEKLIIKILYDVIKALYYLHKRNILHNDLCIENIRGEVTNENTIIYKICGLKGAIFLRDNTSGVHELGAGKQGYVSEERFCSRGLVSKFSDIYAFGAIGYFLLNDISIYNDEIEKKINTKCSNCKNLNIEVEAKLCGLCNIDEFRCLCITCKECKLCRTCKLCTRCEYCRHCILCVQCKKTLQNDLSKFRVDTDPKPDFSTNNVDLKDVIVCCLSEKRTRPNIQNLLNYSFTRSLFAEHWNDEDFPV